MKQSQSKKALVTGASGFIGHHLTKRLLADGWEVSVLTRAGTRSERLPPVGAASIFEHDGTTAGAIRIIKKARPMYIFHLAGKAAIEHRAADVDQLVEANVRLGIQLAEGAVRCGSPFFVNTGTFWQHDADVRYAPNSLYAATKQALQDVLHFYSTDLNLLTLTLKLTDTYGPSDPRERLIPLLMRWKSGDPPLVLSPGDQLIDLVHVEDVVSAYLHAAHMLAIQGGQFNESYHVSSGRWLSIRQIVDIVQKVAQKHIEVEWGGRAYRRREIMEPWRGNVLPSWAPQIRLEEGIRKLIAI